MLHGAKVARVFEGQVINARSGTPCEPIACRIPLFRERARAAPDPATTHNGGGGPQTHRRRVLRSKDTSGACNATPRFIRVRFAEANS
jgi:hypothetical protein